MTKEQVLDQVLATNSLPTLSNVASKLITITGKEETTIGEITTLIAQDVSLSAKVLKVVNSAFYNFPNEVSTIQQAVAILGTKAIRSLVLSFSFLSMEQHRRDGGFDYQQFWEHSLATAVSAKMISKLIKISYDPEELFTAGLLQNIGVLILAQAFPAVYDRLLLQLIEGEDELTSLEEQQIGATHPFIGHAAAQHWHFPETLVEPIRYHHDPESAPTGNGDLLKIIQVCYLAGLVAKILYSHRPISYAEDFRKEARRLLKLSGKDVDQVFEMVSHEVAAAAEYFDLKIDGSPSIPEILQKANIELSLLNLSYEQLNRELVEAKLQLELLNTELQEKNRYLESIANLDGLTEVYNHRYFQEQFDRELNRAIRTGRPLTLLMADLDKFKGINDCYGHQAGDFVLRETCRVWREQIRDYDLLARYGGEEFVFMLPETCRDDALVAAEKLRRAIDEHTFARDQERYGVTCSIGVVTFTVDEEKLDKDELMARADSALYEAKKKGRNRVEYFAEKKGKWYQKLRING